MRKRLSGGYNGLIPGFLVNLSAEPYTLYYSYNTVANGEAEDIVCPPHAYIFLHDKGDAREFATWIVETDFTQLPADSMSQQLRWSHAVVIMDQEKEEAHV